MTPKNLAQGIRNAYDGRDRDALERYLEQVAVIDEAHRHPDCECAGACHCHLKTPYLRRPSSYPAERASVNGWKPEPDAVNRLHSALASSALSGMNTLAANTLTAPPNTNTGETA